MEKDMNSFSIETVSDKNATDPTGDGDGSGKQGQSIDIVEAVALFNGDSYAGGWRLGRRHGKGIYKFASGSRYEGEWLDGEMVGWGVYIMEDGTRRNIRHKK
mmetsp:Transcript_38884/g.50313  ORF Transcript_38884/g.50313 Transcript_38884/m.50313 type:complete len:102 (+) Transcript_38884:2497-2802(+)